MRISELAERTGVSVASLKFYLREGLLMPGVAQSQTRADYDEDHVARVRLLRALIDIGNLSLADARRVVEALESESSLEPADLMGVAHEAIPGRGREHPVTTEVAEFIERAGWLIHPENPSLHSLSAALEATRSAGVPVDPQSLERYAAASLLIAAADIDATTAQATPEDVLRHVVVGTVLIDEVLSSLRRLAEAHTVAERFGLEPC